MGWEGCQLSRGYKSPVCVKKEMQEQNPAAVCSLPDEQCCAEQFMKGRRLKGFKLILEIIYTY